MIGFIIGALVASAVFIIRPTLGATVRAWLLARWRRAETKLDQSITEDKE